MANVLSVDELIDKIKDSFQHGTLSDLMRESITFHGIVMAPYRSSPQVQTGKTFRVSNDAGNAYIGCFNQSGICTPEPRTSVSLVGYCQWYLTGVRVRVTGMIDEKRAALQENLERLGLFDKTGYVQFPQPLSCIAIIGTKEIGIVDAKKGLEKSGVSFVKIYELPVAFYGKSPDETATAICDAFNKAMLLRPYCVLLVRGGLDNFDALDEESAVRAVHDCCLNCCPVVTGLGHSVSLRTFCDLAATRDAETPSLAGVEVGKEIMALITGS